MLAPLSYKQANNCFYKGSIHLLDKQNRILIFPGSALIIL